MMKFPELADDKPPFMTNRLLVMVTQGPDDSFAVTGYDPVTCGMLSIELGRSSLEHLWRCEGLHAGHGGALNRALLARCARM